MQNTGSLAIVDATNSVVKSFGPTVPQYTTGILLSSQYLVQVTLPPTPPP